VTASRRPEADTSTAAGPFDETPASKSPQYCEVHGIPWAVAVTDHSLLNVEFTAIELSRSPDNFERASQISRIANKEVRLCQLRPTVHASVSERIYQKK